MVSTAPAVTGVPSFNPVASAACLVTGPTISSELYTGGKRYSGTSARSTISFSQLPVWMLPKRVRSILEQFMENLSVNFLIINPSGVRNLFPRQMSSGWLSIIQRMEVNAQVPFASLFPPVFLKRLLPILFSSHRTCSSER